MNKSIVVVLLGMSLLATAHLAQAQPTKLSYGVSYFETGRLSAKYVQRILTGANPKDLPVESLSRVELAVNLKTAREIGVTVPQAVRLRADKVIE